MSEAVLAACCSAYLWPLARGSWGLLLGHGFRHPIDGVALERKVIQCLIILWRCRCSPSYHLRWCQWCCPSGHPWTLSTLQIFQPNERLPPKEHILHFRPKIIPTQFSSRQKENAWCRNRWDLEKKKTHFIVNQRISGLGVSGSWRRIGSHCWTKLKILQQLLIENKFKTLRVNRG